MGIAAAPRYVGVDFSTAPPGHRFGMYLKLWGVESRTGEKLWTTHDVNYRTSGQRREERSFKDENKTKALKEALKLSNSDRRLMKALFDRQLISCLSLETSGQLLRLDATSIAPFSTGLGNEHPLENGFAFLNPYGLPYLPGSGVKGVLRTAARELCEGFYGEPNQDGWSKTAINALFGVEDGNGDPQRGALMFWDVIPQISGDALKVEIMTPHQGHYYQQRESPHESGSINPINFLAVPPGSGFAFHIQCDQPFLANLAPELAEDGRWQSLIRSALLHAFDWLGFGAKTAVGYGAMQINKKAESDREYDREQQALALIKQAQETARNEALSKLSPVDRKIEQAKSGKQAGQTDSSAVYKALKENQFDAAEIREAAQKLKELMQSEKGSWKESTSAKKPEKDKEYKRTQEVMKWLKD